MREIPAGIVDAVITDPPYSSGGMVRGDRTMTTKKKYLQSDSGNLEKLADFTGDNRDQRSFHYWAALWTGAALRIAKPGAVLAVFCDWRQLPVSTDYVQAGGWVWRGIVPWAKTCPRPQLGRFAAQCEYVVWCSAGPLPTERGVGCLPGWFHYSAPQQRKHITQKPEDLMRDIVRIAPAGGLVLDPFIGSGTTLAAAAKTGRHYLGFELGAAACEGAARRLEAIEEQPAAILSSFEPIEAR
jgi:site-specific DNA-methyltransferase (adenine-specific)